MITRDKLNEAIFFYGEFKRTRLGDAKRYLFSALISAWRSVTWVMQSEYRPVFKEKFNRWYEQKVLYLSGLPYAKQLLSLRTIAQHEGGLYPQLIIDLQDTQSGHLVRLHYDAPNRFFKKVELHFMPTGPGKPFRARPNRNPDGTPRITPAELKLTMLRLAAYMKEVNSSQALLKFKDAHFVLDSKGTTLSSAEMTEVVGKHLSVLRTVVDELEQTFGDLRPKPFFQAPPGLPDSPSREKSPGNDALGSLGINERDEG